MTAVIGAVAGTMDARTAAAAAATSTLRGGGGRRVGVAGAVARREAALSTDQRVVLPFAFFFLLQSLFVARSSLNSLSNLNGTEDRPHVGMVQRNLVVITDRAAQQERISLLEYTTAEHAPIKRPKPISKQMSMHHCC
jgi:hypothetical protein